MRGAQLFLSRKVRSTSLFIQEEKKKERKRKAFLPPLKHFWFLCTLNVLLWLSTSSISLTRWLPSPHSLTSSIEKQYINSKTIDALSDTTINSSHESIVQQKNHWLLESRIVDYGGKGSQMTFFAQRYFPMYVVSKINMPLCIPYLTVWNCNT